MSSPFDSELRDAIVQFANRMKWDHFFTGTFKKEYSREDAFEHARQFFVKENERYTERYTNPLSYLLMVEGARQESKNYLCDNTTNRFQGKAVKRKRVHIHALLAFEEPVPIRVNSGEPHPIWTRWFDLHGRVAITPVKNKQEVVAYVVKYATKSVITGDTWTVHL